MKFPKKTIFNSRHALHMFALTLLVAIMSVAASAQKTVSFKSDFAPAAPPNLDQCANGANGAPLLQCTGANWQNGNLNENNSQWVEGQSVPYRVVFTDLVAGSTGNTIVLEYDTTENGKHSLDYLTTVNQTATDADPCSGQPAPCDSNVYSSWAIPVDPLVTGAGVTPIPGQFRMYGGGTITNVSGITTTGTFAGTSKSQMTITFDAGATPNSVVLAWSGHISTRFDWGFEFSAVNLPGSPYHMRIVGTGNQDRSMSVAGIIFPGYLYIRKQVNYVSNGVAQTTYPLAFGFNGTNWGTNSYSLTDNRPGNEPVANDPNEATYTDIQVVQYTTFGQTITVTEPDPPAPWSLTNLTCSINGGGNPTVGTVDANLATGTATIVLAEANIATCVFNNSAVVTTAAPASISGRVSTADGTGISNARMTLMNASTGETFYALTNAFGYYTFEGMPVADFYILSVGHKRYSFSDEQRAFTLEDDLMGVDFIAN